MYIYQITGWSYDDEQCDDVPNINYLMHSEQFTKTELDNMCESIFAERKAAGCSKWCTTLIPLLKRNFGFVDLQIETSFEFHED
jgi:hypothetical protein